MFDGSTIVARATPPGRSVRAVVRLSGPAVGGVLASLFRPAPAGRAAVPSRLDLGAPLPVLLMRYVAPASYTGEDSAEVVLPGNPLLVERVIDRLCAAPGVRRAGPGEFTARAFLSGRLSLDRAEGVAGVIAARTDEELREARALLAGERGALYRAWAEDLASLLALVEAGIDFADQEGVVVISPDSALDRASALDGAIARRLGAAAGAEAPPEFPRVVLFGEPNAGKSTLFNALLGARRAVASPLPGTTRDALAEPLDLPSGPAGVLRVLLVDAPGLDDRARGAAPRAARAAAAAAAGRADVLLHCDPSGRFAAAPGVSAAIIRVRTKADRLCPGGHPDALPVCALDGWNLGALRERIAASACRPRPEVLPRHADALGRARRALARARERTAADPALFAAGLREALDALGELTGRITPDGVLGRIFAAFCIGK